MRCVEIGPEEFAHKFNRNRIYKTDLQAKIVRIIVRMVRKYERQKDKKIEFKTKNFRQLSFLKARLALKSRKPIKKFGKCFQEMPKTAECVIMSN